MLLTVHSALWRISIKRFSQGVAMLLAIGAGSLQAQGYRGGTQSGPSFDDLPVLIYRMVVVESKKPLVEHGKQLSEADFSTRLEQWRTSGMADIVVDKGFILPEGTQPIDPNFNGAGGRAVMLGAHDSRSPGPALKIRVERTAEGYHSEAALSIWAMTGHSLKDSLSTLDNPAMVTGAAPVSALLSKITGVPCRQGPEVQLTWDTPLKSVTALVCESGDGSSRYCTVFLNPISARSSLIDQPGLPKTYQAGTLRMVGGAVPSGSFWSYIKNSRPDIIRPRVMGGGIMELFWSDDEWQTFTEVMKQVGTAWANLPDAKLSAERPSISLNAPQMGVSIALANSLPSQGYVLKLDCPTMTSEGPGAKVTGDQFGITLPGLCESHQRRWTLFARVAGNVTYLLASRPEFEEGLTVAPAKATAVVEAAPPIPPQMLPPVQDAPKALKPASPEPLPLPLVAAADALHLYEGEWVGSINSRPNARMTLICTWDEKKQEMQRESKIEMEPGYSKAILSSTIMKREEGTGVFQSRLVPVNNAPPAVAEGDWNPVSRTFTWRALDQRTGSRMVTTATFPREDIMEWRQIMTLSTGEEVINEGGRNVRTRR